MPPPLHLYSDGSAHVIAIDPLDASAAWAEHLGPGETHNDTRYPWRERTTSLSFYDHAGDLCSGTPTELIEEYGRGYLCSEDR